MSKSEIFRSRLLGAALCPLMAVAFAAGGTTTVRAKGVSYDVLYTFTGGNDGANPSAGLIHDSAGNLYGTTPSGGANGQGAVFKLAPDGTATVLYSFTGGNDGGDPLYGALIMKKGNLYGTTGGGGANGQGTIFRLSTDGTETTLYSFAAGDQTLGGVTRDKAGNFYGTTFQGGANGYGSVFKLAPNGTETMLYSFTNGSDGRWPYAGVILDEVGNLYSTTYEGGTGSYGTVFKLAPDGTETVLHAFSGTDGGFPGAVLTLDAAGNLYGTTQGGGTSGNGAVFKLTPNGTETVLYSFTGENDGANPYSSPLLIDGKGNLYGTTCCGGAGGNGTVFEVAPDGNESVLHAFSGSDGGFPVAGLIKDHGYFYGTTQSGGANGSGIVFRLKK